MNKYNKSTIKVLPLRPQVPPLVPHLSGINVSDELQRLLQGLAHAELQLLDGSHILDTELGARFRRAVAFNGE